MNDKDEKRLRKNVSLLSKLDLVTTFEKINLDITSLKEENKQLKNFVHDLFSMLNVDDSIIYELQNVDFDISKIEDMESIVHNFSIGDSFLTLLETHNTLFKEYFSEKGFNLRVEQLKEKRRRLRNEKDRKRRKQKSIKDNNLF